MNGLTDLKAVGVTPWILWLAAVLHTGLAGWMLVDPAGWFVTIAGVTHTGPYNQHLVRDVGIAYLTVAGGFAIAAYWRRAAFPVFTRRGDLVCWPCRNPCGGYPNRTLSAIAHSG